MKTLSIIVIFVILATNGIMAQHQNIIIGDPLGNAHGGPYSMHGYYPATGPNGEVYVTLWGPEGLMFDQSLDDGITWLDSDQWEIVNGQVVEHLERQAFMGTAFLKDVEFQNGVIEVDIAVTGARSYPGVNFRIQSKNDYERFYIRPHRAGLYPDAVQYTPSMNGISEWQLCNGKGYTAGSVFPENEWVHFKIEILDTRARVFINDKPQPALEIYSLKHGISKGTIGLNGPANGSAFFSNFKYQITENLVFNDPPVKDLPIGMIMDWEISRVYKSPDIEFDKTPEQQDLTDIKWQKLKADEYGLLDIGKFHGRIGRSPDAVFARTTLIAKKDTLLEMKYGYSDAIAIFINGQPISFGNSAYQQRDPSFLGIIGLNDAVFLPLKKGDNELLLIVAESFGGWGFMCQRGNETYFAKGISKAWETEKVFATSESVLYDPNNEVLYVTNFDQFNMGNQQVSQYISKLSLTGEIINLKWVDGLNNPLGMTIHDNKIYCAERGQVAVIDISKGEILERISVEGSAFLNDIAIDSKGIIYISDSRKNVIWKITDGDVAEWLSEPEVLDPNVLYFYKDKLLIGNSGDSWLKSVDTENKTITNIAHFPEGFIDGIRPDGKGNLLVSLWKGKIYSVKPSGEIKLVFHTENLGEYTADFEYIPEKKLLLIPAFYENKVAAYNMDF
ncbi:MAG: hypothetical protein K8S16_20065 [Bacteroidales bacterium]|nr:hypothetical protein [Bacteroidales bacterium]